MKAGWEHVINENGVDERFAPNTLATQVLMEENGETLLEAMKRKLESETLVITSAQIADAAIKDAHIENAGISAAKIRDLSAEAIKAVCADFNNLEAGEIKTRVIDAVCAELDNVESDKIKTRVINAVCAELDNVESDKIKTRVINAVSANLQDVDAGELRAQVIDAVEADIGNLSAGKLYANVIEAVKVEIDKLAAGKFFAAMAEICEATIQSAKIDFAQVQDLIAGDAIISKGVGDKLYIDNLAVTDANMVSLTLGELIVKGNDDNFYAIVIDEDGNVKPELKTITGDNVTDGSLSGKKIIDNSITAQQLNVSDILASEALIGAITADHIKVGDLFANQVFTKELETQIINSAHLSVEIQDATKKLSELSMFFDFTNKGLKINKPNGAFSVSLNDQELGFYQDEQRVAYISDSKLHETDAVVDNSLIIGKHKFEMESDGALSLTWIGGEA